MIKWAWSTEMASAKWNSCGKCKISCSTSFGRQDKQNEIIIFKFFIKLKVVHLSCNESKSFAIVAAALAETCRWKRRKCEFAILNWILDWLSELKPVEQCGWKCIGTNNYKLYHTTVRALGAVTVVNKLVKFRKRLKVKHQKIKEPTRTPWIFGVVWMI